MRKPYAERASLRLVRSRSIAVAKSTEIELRTQSSNAFGELNRIDLYRFESNRIQFNRVKLERNGDYRCLLTRAAAGDGAPDAGDNGGRAFSRDMARVAQIAAPMSLLCGVWPQGSYPGTRAAAGSRRQGETANTSSFV